MHNNWVKNNMIFLTCLIVSLIVGCIMGYNYKNPTFTNQNIVTTFSKTYIEPDTPPEKSIEEMYQDIFMIFLLPYIDKSIDDYYGTPYAVAPYSTKVLSIERPNGYRTFEFLIKLEVSPYTGAHNTVGVDHITFRISTGPSVKMEKFQHIKSY